MKKLLMIMCALLFVFCAKRKTTVETEGLEEVLVFGEEGTENVSDEPVLPQPIETSPTTGEEPVMPPPATEEEIVSPPIIEEEIVSAPPSITEETLPPVIEEPYVHSTITPPPTTTVPPRHTPAQVLGFRIQIFASSTENNASKVADDARKVFGQSVYVNYIAPYYKVRVGNCLTNEEAQVLKSQAINKGYRGAFVVETMITP